MSKMGRPPIEINWDDFDKLCLFQCTLREIATWFDCSEDTIENKVQEVQGMTFSEYYKIKRGHGKIALRRKQFQTAMEGSVPMLIWLGKNWLDQTDKQNIEVKETVTIQTKLEAIKTNVINMIIDQPKGLLGVTQRDRELTGDSSGTSLDGDTEGDSSKEPVSSG